MKAIILAAGEGVRMRPLTLTTPKPLLSLAGKPLLHRLVEALPEKVDELVFVIGYRGEQIKEYCGDRFLGRPVAYVTQPERRGTFHALELCEPLLRGGEPFAFFYADDLLDAETVAACLAHPLAAVTTQVEHPERFGVVTLNPDGTIRDIVEKPTSPTSNLVLTTAYTLTPHIFRYRPAPHPASGEYYLSTALGAMAKEHPVRAVTAKLWVPIGTPEDLARAEALLSAQSPRS